MRRAPVVLNVGSWRNGVPVASTLVAILTVVLSVAEDEVGIVQSALRISRASASRCRGRSVKSEAALRFRKVVLDLFVDCPAKPELELVRAFGPGQIIADLIVIRGVVPRHPIDGVVGVGAPGQIDVRDAVVNIGPGEDPVLSLGESGGLLVYPPGQDVNAVAVVTEGSLVQEIRPDSVSGMHRCAVGRIPEGISNGRHIVATPHALAECL